MCVGVDEASVILLFLIHISCSILTFLEASLVQHAAHS